MGCGCSKCDCDGSSRYLYSVDDILAVLNRLEEHGKLIMKSRNVRWYDVDRWTVVTQFYGDRFDFVEYLESPTGRKVDFWEWDDGRDDGHPVNKIILWKPIGALQSPPSEASAPVRGSSDTSTDAEAILPTLDPSDLDEGRSGHDSQASDGQGPCRGERGQPAKAADWNNIPKPATNFSSRGP